MAAPAPRDRPWPLPGPPANFRADEDVFISFADDEEEVAHQRAAGVDVQRCDDLGVETGASAVTA